MINECFRYGVVYYLLYYYLSLHIICNYYLLLQRDLLVPPLSEINMCTDSTSRPLSFT